MVSKADIENTIKELDNLYNSNSTQSLYFSKLALLELCGWIEQSMDSIVVECSNLKLSEQTNRKLVEERIVKRTYGFHYEDHFRPMLMKLIGLIKLEQIEDNLKATGDLAILTSQLGSLRQSRDSAAHTSISGTTPSFEAPSRIKAYLDKIFPIMKKVESELQAI